MNSDIQAYNQKLNGEDLAICNKLAEEIAKHLPDAESKVWHGSPAWFLEGNPVAGYCKLKDSVQILFWSGQSFDEPGLQPEGSFKAAEKRFAKTDQINTEDLERWLNKARNIQWDYKNIVKRKGKLERIV